MRLWVGKCYWSKDQLRHRGITTRFDSFFPGLWASIGRWAIGRGPLSGWNETALARDSREPAGALQTDGVRCTLGASQKSESKS
jgi:hypothetical protein